MARPLKNNADYFSHDNDMRNNARIKAVRMKHGLEGYAVWCMLLETLTKCDRFTLEVDELTIEVMAGDFAIDLELLETMLQSFRRLKLIEYNSEHIKCPALVERMQPLELARDRKRQWVEQLKTSKTKTNGVLDVQNSTNNTNETYKIPKVKESKLKIKIKESKDDDVIGKTPPTPQFDESQSIKNLSNSVADFFANPEEGALDFQKIEKFRAAFEREMKATGKKHDSERDLIQHFIFWVRKKNGGGAKAGPAPSAGVNRRAGVNDIRMTEEDYNRPQYF